MLPCINWQGISTKDEQRISTRRNYGWSKMWMCGRLCVWWIDVVFISLSVFFILLQLFLFLGFIVVVIVSAVWKVCCCCWKSCSPKVFYFTNNCFCCCCSINFLLKILVVTKLSCLSVYPFFLPNLLLFCAIFCFIFYYYFIYFLFRC